jgi:cytochrome c oxidase subunit IV
MPTDLSDHEAIPTAALDGAVEEYPREKLYVFVAIFLAAVTWIEVMTYLKPGWFGSVDIRIATLLFLMAVKFFTVAYVFMHLKFDKKILTVVFYSGLGLAVAVYVAILTILNVWSHGHPHP